MEKSTVEFVDKQSTKVLDKGEVRLLNSMGGDLSVIAAARVSNGVSFEEASKGAEKDFKLISYLIKHRHGTPFEHASFQFFVKVPLFVRSQFQRHRLMSFNEISGRYVEYEPEFYIPDKIRVQAENNKQGSVEASKTGVLANFTDGEILLWNDSMRLRIESTSKSAFSYYRYLLDKGVAKEMARMILPTNLYTQFYITVNARSLMNFLGLRAAEDAQWEIRQYAIAMKEMFKRSMPLTYKAWENNGFLAP